MKIKQEKLGRSKRQEKEEKGRTGRMMVKRKLRRKKARER